MDHFKTEYRMGSQIISYTKDINKDNLEKVTKTARNCSYIL